MKIVRYDETYHNIWNEFLSRAKNYHFFFNREYLSYHGKRLKDHSLLIYDEKNRLTAMLAANICDLTLYSHSGLTFGGFIVGEGMKVSHMIEISHALKTYLRQNGIKRLYYKALPFIHHTKPSQEDLYVLFLQQAALVKRDISSVIDLTRTVRYSNGRRWSVKKAKKHNFSIERSYDFKPFWELLENTLKENHDASPTHSLEEITYLASKFPDNIKLFTLLKENTLIAGCVTYENPGITHLQYVANSKEGRSLNALDFLIDDRIKESLKDKRYFSFGTSAQKGKNEPNYGLIDQKERFGASAVTYDHYEWKIS